MLVAGTMPITDLHKIQRWYILDRGKIKGQSSPPKVLSMCNTYFWYQTGA